MDAKLLADLLPARFQGQLTALAGGLTNRSWRLDTAEQSYWLRLGNPHSASLGIDRALELVAHQAAATAGLAPVIHYAKPAVGLLLLDWQPEPDWQQLAPQPEDLRRLMTQVAQLHQLTPLLPALSLTAQAERYLGQLTGLNADLSSDLSSGLNAELPRYARRFKHARLNLDYVPVFCHHDLNAANVLGARPWLIDWEYAAYGDAAFELAVIADSFALHEQGARQLLMDYNGAGGEVCERRFQARRPWVAWLTVLWAALQYQYTGRADYRLLQHQAMDELDLLLADFPAD